MISYQWYLSPDQPFNKKELFKLQYCLYAAGIYLDLSWKDGSPVMTISVPEQAPEDKSGLITEESISSSDSGPCNDALESLDPKAPAHKRGRPSVVPKRFMGISVEAIAKEIGVSKRTFYRRWTQAEKLGLDPDTPFSQWIRP